MQSRNKDRPFVVGICGGSGSGKTYILDLLAIRLGHNACFLSQDHYYKPLALQERDDNGQVNFDLPSAIDESRFVRDLDLLTGGNSITLKEYTFNNPSLPARTLQLKPAPLIIVEGLFIFHAEEISKRLSLKVFVESGEALALERRLERDSRERAYTEEMVRYQWKYHVMPAYERYLLPYRDTADVLIRNPGESMPDLQPLLDLLYEKCT
ncbi:uridine kinase [Anseongella ginsenosidimutans]|uniref:Uridine kinase n=1 Tax=Anseongella ginsenosidimutans TaxID=496056 RepID=A0A4R3KT84_9SPHI|nr:uridine kinase [Anseongella ginsenosidimutans]QEC53472.1 uridine kinase [Anseongella ginsenosidimutans]TCS88364.1 uridine kinase [Anseongella ginsenosidimutans]